MVLGYNHPRFLFKKTKNSRGIRVDTVVSPLFLYVASNEMQEKL